MCSHRRLLATPPAPSAHKLASPAGPVAARLNEMAAIMWGQEVAEVYDATSAAMFAPEVIEPTVDLLFELANGGPVLELAIGTGRVALPLHARGVAVSGIELSPHMAAQLRAKPGAEAIPVTIGDMATTRVDGTFTLVYLVFNTIMNLTTQDEQVAVFANAAAHLQPGGLFLVEVGLPALRRLPPGEAGLVFDMRPEHVGIDTFDDPIGQITWSHHWTDVDGRLVRHAAPYRYVWPSELDLMAKLAGLHRVERWSGWSRQPFTPESTAQVTVFRKDDGGDTRLARDRDDGRVRPPRETLLRSRGR